MKNQKLCATCGHTSVHTKLHHMLSNGFSRVNLCDRQTTDRRTDHVTATFVALAGLADAT